MSAIKENHHDEIEAGQRSATGQISSPGSGEVSEGRRGIKKHRHTTYIRKYYLHRQVKKAGFSLELEQCHKTINVYPNQVPEAKENRYVAELQQQHNYGVQILNPIIDGKEIH